MPVSAGCRRLYPGRPLPPRPLERISVERGATLQTSMSNLKNLATVVLRSERLSLRSFVATDAVEAFREATLQISRYMTWDPSPSIEAFAEIWQVWRQQMASGTDLFLTARLASTDTFLGVAGLHQIGNPEPVVGIWIKETSQRIGYGREAIAAIAKWASANVGAVALIYPVVEQNLPSRRLAESLQGTVTGARKLRKSSGASFDEVIYRIPVTI